MQSAKGWATRELVGKYGARVGSALGKAGKVGLAIGTANSIAEFNACVNKGPG